MPPHTADLAVRRGQTKRRELLGRAAHHTRTPSGRERHAALTGSGRRALTRSRRHRSRRLARHRERPSLFGHSPPPGRQGPAISHPIFVNGQNYAGGSPPLTRHPLLRPLARASLAAQVPMAAQTLVGPAGHGCTERGLAADCRRTARLAPLPAGLPASIRGQRLKSSPIRSQTRNPERKLAS